MTSIYIAPEANGESNELEELAQKAGVPVLVVDKLYELIQRVDDPIIVARMKNHDVVTLMRNLTTLLPEIPSVIVSAPGSRHSTEFMSVTASLHGVDWKELSAKFSKSGLLSQTTEQAESRTTATRQGHKPGGETDEPERIELSTFASRNLDNNNKNAPVEEEFDESSV